MCYQENDARMPVFNPRAIAYKAAYEEVYRAVANAFVHETTDQDELHAIASEVPAMAAALKELEVEKPERYIVIAVRDARRHAFEDAVEALYQAAESFREQLKSQEESLLMEVQQNPNPVCEPCLEKDTGKQQTQHETGTGQYL